MNKIKSYENIVIKALENNARARIDDFELYLTVLEELGINTNISISDILMNAKVLSLPAFETITRIRRKLKKTHPHLLDISMQKKRDDYTIEYIIYSKF